MNQFSDQARFSYILLVSIFVNNNILSNVIRGTASILNNLVANYALFFSWIFFHFQPLVLLAVNNIAKLCCWLSILLRNMIKWKKVKHKKTYTHTHLYCSLVCLRARCCTGRLILWKGKNERKKKQLWVAQRNQMSIVESLISDYLLFEGRKKGKTLQVKQTKTKSNVV